MPKMIISADAGNSQGKGCSEVSQRGSQARGGAKLTAIVVMAARAPQA